MTQPPRTIITLSLPKSVWVLIGIGTVMVGVAFLAMAATIGLLADEMGDRDTAATKQRSQLILVVSDLEDRARGLEMALDAERAQDDAELRQDRCEDAYRREVERSEALALTALARALSALGTPQLDAARQVFMLSTERLERATQAQDEYVRNGRELPCPVEGG